MKLNREVAQQLEDLNQEMQNAMLGQESSGVRRPANTFVGKMDQVHQWVNTPSSDPAGLGGCIVPLFLDKELRILIRTWFTRYLY